MAFESQITRAAVRDRAPIGADAMHRDAILALPATERAAAVLELERARRCVLRMVGEHVDEVLAMLELDPRSEQEKATATRTAPDHPALPATPPTPRTRPHRRGEATHKQCAWCRQVKPIDEFPASSYRCHACREGA